MKPLIAALYIVFSAASYADEAFQLIATLSPPGGGSFQPVLRFQILGTGGPASPGAIDVAFSPDGMEMFVGSHFGQGINRFAYNANTDSWTLTGNIPTASLGGLATTFAPFLPGDIDQNGCVDDVDLARLLSMFGFTGDLPEDLNDDGVVDDTDLAVLLTNFGRGC
ncbi:MAG: hypothetical protein HUU60_11410 [Armatimonadetes bacterium]|nr:hypothetical protein [Armatimonadota bacterium]